MYNPYYAAYKIFKMVAAAEFFLLHRRLKIYKY